jgi:hypothetical protein
MLNDLNAKICKLIRLNSICITAIAQNSSDAATAKEKKFQFI